MGLVWRKGLRWPPEIGIEIPFAATEDRTGGVPFSPELRPDMDGNTRRFICVQLPEPVSSDSEVAARGFHSIADICKERIRRVIARMKKADDGKLDLKMRGTPEDLGFKVFGLAESNYKPWAGVKEKDPAALRALNLGKDDLFICRDVALTDDLAANLALQCRLKTI